MLKLQQQQQQQQSCQALPSSELLGKLLPRLPSALQVLVLSLNMSCIIELSANQKTCLLH